MSLTLLRLGQLMLNEDLQCGTLACFMSTQYLIFTIHVWLTGRTARWRWSSWVRWKKPFRLLSSSTTTTWERTTICECPSPNPPSSTRFTTNTPFPHPPCSSPSTFSSLTVSSREYDWLTNSKKKKNHYRYSWGSFRDFPKKRKKKKSK